MSPPDLSSFLVLLLVGLLVGVTTVLFGFGGGFVTVPVITVADAALGGDAVRVATATSALVMLVNAVVATLATRRETLARLRGRGALFVLLGVGGALGAAVARTAPGAVIRWGFVLYVAVTAVDLLARPGFLRPAPAAPGTARAHGVPTGLGLPIGGIAAFLGVGGSVLTVPLMRRAGAPMPIAAALANPLTLVIVAPALLVSLLTRGHVPGGAGLVGSVDVVSALALLAGSLPVVVALRRRPPRIPEAVHAGTYIALLVAAGATVAVTG
ncbi:sulfite exporter TauE/SafE family protein [Streptomyces sp. NPDC046939]|uniref:sulfite exporter TauE/SafE family protein n=1 Tax=Streptomyces sp. NPDC046939 TaxID=3155376 RepID=UPI0033C75809